MNVCIGCAGWSIPKEHAAHFPVDGSHLQRYAGRFNAVEINSSFYRPHQPRTYARWATSVPQGFRFAVKVPRSITHERRLKEIEDLLEPFLAQAGGLGNHLGPLLVQLPPSLVFNASMVRQFLTVLRQRFGGEVACEPRHATWFRPGVGPLLADFQVARVAADPAVVPAAAEPGGWDGLGYYRLHGSPQMYYSAYSAPYLDALRQKLDRAALAGSCWCIFDNTALGAATANALDLCKRLAGQAQPGR